MSDFEIIIRLINSFFTIGLGLLLVYLYFRKMRFISLLSWSIGFVLYGFQILMRIWYPWNTIEILLVSMSMGPLFILGVSNIMRQNKIYGIILIVLAIFTIILFRLDYWVPFATLGFFGYMTIALIHLRAMIGKTADRFIVGWLTLLIANLVFLSMVKLEWLADLIAIPAKVILALGMLDQRFAQMILDVRKIYGAYRLATTGGE